MNEEEIVRSDATFDFQDGDYEPARLRSLYREALRQHRALRQVADYAMGEAERLAWQVEELRSELAKRQVLLDRALVRLGIQRGQS